MTSDTQIAFVRHGAVHNPRDVHYGRLPRFALSETGVRQARAAAHALGGGPIAALYASPLLRARQTAAILRGAHPQARLHFSILLTEVHSPFDGRPARELAVRHWDLYADSPAGFEQPTDLLRRVRRFLWSARTRYAGRRIVAVTHGDLIAFTILWARSAPLTQEAAQDLTRWGFAASYPATGSITRLSFRTADPDERPHLAYLLPQGCASGSGVAPAAR